MKIRIAITNRTESKRVLSENKSAIIWNWLGSIIASINIKKKNASR